MFVNIRSEGSLNQHFKLKHPELLSAQARKELGMDDLTSPPEEE